MISMQGYALGIACFCDRKLTVTYFLGQSLYNMILNYAKTGMTYFDLSLKQEMFVIWLYFMFWISCFFVSLLLFSRTRNYKEIIS